MEVALELAAESGHLLLHPGLGLARQHRPQLGLPVLVLAASLLRLLLGPLAGAAQGRLSQLGGAVL